MNLHLHAQLTAQDYADAATLHGQKVILITLGVSSCLGIGCLLYFTSGMGSIARIVGTSLTVLGLLYVFKIRNRGVVVRTKKLFAQQKDLQIPYEIAISETDLQLTSARSQGRMSWEDFYKWRANEKVILLYRSDALFHVFPRHFFASAADFAAFKEFLKTRLGPAGKARKSP